MWQYKLSAVNRFLSIDPLLRIYLESLGGKLSAVKDLGTKCQLPSASVRLLSGNSTIKLNNLRAIKSKKHSKTKNQLLTKCGQGVGIAQGVVQDCRRGRLLWEGLWVATPGEYAAHPHPPLSFQSPARNPHSESKQSQWQRSPLTKSIWAQVE